MERKDLGEYCRRCRVRRIRNTRVKIPATIATGTRVDTRADNEALLAIADPWFYDEKGEVRRIWQRHDFREVTYRRHRDEARCLALTFAVSALITVLRCTTV